MDRETSKRQRVDRKTKLWPKNKMKRTNKMILVFVIYFYMKNHHKLGGWGQPKLGSHLKVQQRKDPLLSSLTRYLAVFSSFGAIWLRTSMSSWFWIMHSHIVLSIGHLTIWRLALSKPARWEACWQDGVITWSIITEMTFLHICHVLLVRSISQFSPVIKERKPWCDVNTRMWSSFKVMKYFATVFLHVYKVLYFSGNIRENGQQTRKKRINILQPREK